jgi:hypothetical protein
LKSKLQHWRGFPGIFRASRASAQVPVDMPVSSGDSADANFRRIRHFKVAAADFLPDSRTRTAPSQ